MPYRSTAQPERACLAQSLAPAQLGEHSGGPVVHGAVAGALEPVEPPGAPLRFLEQRQSVARPALLDQQSRVAALGLGTGEARPDLGVEGERPARLAAVLMGSG